MRNLNRRVTDEFKAQVDLKRDGNRLFTEALIKSGNSSNVIQKTIHQGTRCPSESSDTNGDGFLDQLEAEAVYGAAIFMMDGDIEEISAEVAAEVEGKVIVMTGASATAIYPESVATRESRPVHETLPVSCGRFKRISTGRSERIEDEDEVTPRIELPPPGAEEQSPNVFERLRTWWRERTVSN